MVLLSPRSAEESVPRSAEETAFSIAEYEPLRNQRSAALAADESAQIHIQ